MLHTHHQLKTCMVKVNDFMVQNKRKRFIYIKKS